MNNVYGTSAQKDRARKWFETLRDRLCVALENIEEEASGTTLYQTQTPSRFTRKEWVRDVSQNSKSNGGGGVMSILRGAVFEKAGVNVSTVFGEFSEDFRPNVSGSEKDPRFWASGISVVVHPRSPLVPATHMNTRMIITGKGWFGGGGDLTPVFPKIKETRLFHAVFEEACDKHDATYYPKFKKWCDEYFYLPHRDEPRGVGGIFFDNLNTGNWEKDFEFVQDVGRAFLSVYPLIVSNVMNIPWNKEQKETQLVKRGRYVEFNLLYDRGTLFGLKTGGNMDAIFMSMPPEVSWR